MNLNRFFLAVLFACLFTSATSYAQSITVTAPNGGEILYACQQYNVTWTQTGSPSNYWNIDYSLDGGTIWTSVASNYLSSNGTFLWTVPNVQSTTVLMRVFDANNPGTVDQSNNFFTINIPVVLTAPNGGESWQGNTVHNITWNTIGTSNTFNLAYSLNNGTTWTNIITNYSTVSGSYAWTVPSVNVSNQCFVRVMDAVTNCMQDVSNTVFTITPPTPQVTYPNGGEQLYANCSFTITWNPASYFSNVQIEYSLNGGASFTVITSNTSNDGTYNWTPPTTPDNEVRIRVCNVENLSINDVSDANFSLLPTVRIVSPNGGENWTTCSVYNVVIDYGPCVGFIGMQYSTDNGVNWNGATITLVSISGNERTYSWQVPNTIGTDDVILRAYDGFSSSNVDVTDAAINVTANSVINVLSPNGGESIAAASSYNITWSNSVQASGVYNIQFSLNNGSSWSTVVNGISGNAYNWTVNNAVSSQCLIRVIDANNTCYQDQSNANFSITGLVPTLTSPNGGESLYAACNYNITWNSSTFYNSVRLEYSSNGGSTWNVITSSTSNDGLYAWSTPNSTGTNYLIKVSQIDNIALNDVSDAAFNIVPHISIVSPTGGETWTTCSTQSVVLDFDPNCVGSVGIQYSTDNGLTWSGPSFTLTAINGNLRTYTWTVSNTITTSTILMRAYDAFNSTYQDITDGAINIVPNTVLSVTSPNGGESYQAVSTQTITWTNTAQASGLYHLYYSTNNGSSWTTIASSISGNAYDWTVANIPSVQCLIRVQDAVNTCYQDVSNAVFTITPQAPVMTSPNGGETLYAACNYNVSWNSSTYYNSVRIEYSSNGGSTWNVITSSTSNDGNYAWTTPNTTGTNYLIKVSQIDNIAINDVSDAAFTMVPHISIVSPTGGETWTTCSTQSVVLDFDPNCVGSVGIQYSTDNGLTWSGPSFTLTAINGNLRTYTWTVSNTITTSTILMRAYDAFNSTYQDITDGAINIVPNTVLTVTSPNGGESYQAVSTQTITWTNTAQASGLYHLYYSTNNGSSWTTIASSISGNAYDWTVANIPSVQCLIRVQDAVNTCYQDVSNAVFTIEPLDAQLTSPNGGEMVYSQNNTSITWNSSTFYNSVRLEYSIDGGLTWIVIATSTSNDGNYTWTPPQADSDECLIKISQIDNLNHFDVSDAFFTINPAVTIITPNGDNGVTIWGGCTVTSITFDRSPAYNTYKLEYSVNNGATWNVITNSWSANTNPATYNWTMPNIPTTHALVKVSPTSNLAYGDVSDDTFTITKPVTIIQPNFGGIMQVGSTFNIQWTSDGISNLYDIFYSTDGGTNFTNIVTGYNTSNNTYPWLVPNIPSSNCRIWVRDNINYCKADTSDIAFVISTTAPPLTITTPNGIMDTLSGCSAYNIAWTETSDITNYDISYSLNSGSTWTDIVTNYAAPSNSYTWTVPNNINSTNVLIRVRSTGQPSTYDLTDAFINIFSGEMIATPEFVSECTNVPIQLSATGGSNYQWTPTTGLSDANIANPIAMPLSSTTYTVTSDVNGCILSDEVTIEVTQSGIPAVITINHDQSGVICEGAAITFNATIESGGSVPHYQWKVNGENVGSNSPQYSTSALTASDIVTCILTSDLPCVSNNPATSNAIQLDIQPNVAPQVTINSSTGNTICDGQDVVFTAIPVYGGDNPSFSWTLNGDPVGLNSATLEGVSLSDNDNIGLSMISNATCITTVNASAPFVTMNVGSIPQSPSGIVGNETLCVGEASVYSVTTVADADSYVWSVPAGWTVSDMGNMINVLAGNSGGEIEVFASNGCGDSDPVTIAVTTSDVPETPLSIDGPASVCNSTTWEYLIVPNAVATSYIWNVPDSWSGNSTSSSILISFDDLSLSDVLTVAAQNDCGISSPQSINVNVGSASVLPSVIAGNESPCPGAVGTYSIDEYPGAISYNWILPEGWSGTSNTNTIEVVSGNVDGQMGVQAVTSCGDSPMRMLDLTIQSAPVITSEIWGETLLCTNAAYSYSIDPVLNADSYSWSVPAGWELTENANSISVISETNGGFIEVFATNECGSSESVQILIDVLDVPQTPLAIDGPLQICEGVMEIYNVDPSEGAAEYTWTLPSGWIGSSNDQLITITSDATDGVIAVAAVNECGSSASTELFVDVLALPQLDNLIQGDAELCSGAIGNYSVNTSNDATAYVWTLPVGWSGNSNNESISVVAGDILGTLSVSATNACGQGNTVSMDVNVAFVPELSALNVPSSWCENATELITVSGSNDVDDYQWTIPSGWNAIGSGSAISLTVNDQSGELEVTGSNACGTSNSLTQLIVVHALPDVTITALPDAEVCAGESVTLFGNGAQGYSWTLGIEDGVAFTPAGSATYQVTGVDANNCSNTSSIAIVVHELPLVQLSLTGDEVQCIETASVTLGGGSPAGGIYSGDGVVGSSLIPEVAGLGAAIIQYAYTDEFGCTSFADDFYIIEVCDAVLENDATESVAIFPNPSAGRFTVTFKNQLSTSGEKWVELYDITGRMVYQSKCYDNQEFLDFSELSSGQYSLRIASEAGNVVVKISIEK